MLDKYSILGLDSSASDEEITIKYNELKSQYQKDRFLEGEKGNEAAKKLTELNSAYIDIMSERNQTYKQENNSTNLFAEVEADLKNNKITEAQQKLDLFDERNAEWHYLQSVVFYKKNWLNECKKQLEIAISMDGNVQKYKDALNKVNNIGVNGSNNYQNWNKSGNVNNATENINDTSTQQLGGNSCMEWCCQMAICNLALNCCCNCR